MTLNFVVIEHTPNAEHLLKKPAKKLNFPLSKDILDLIENMKKKVLEAQGVGLAANQVGYHLQLIIFHVDDYSFQTRKDAFERVPLTVLINPSYQPIMEEGMTEDWEGCFSVYDHLGKVPRYNSIYFEGYDIQGKKIKDKATGFLARVLQHEIDHINGYLILDRLTKDNLQGTIEDMNKIREQEYEQENPKDN